MKIAVSNTNVVADVPALKALTPTDGEIKYVTSENKTYYFESKMGSGHHAPDTGSGFWVEDLNANIYYGVCNNYDFAGNSATEVTNASIVSRFEGGQIVTNGNYNIDFALFPLIREDFKSFQINEVDYTSVKQITQRLQRKDTFVDGRLIKVEYFQTYDRATDTGTNKVIEVDMVYYMDANNLVDYRETTRNWYLCDNTTIGVSTLSTKQYTYQEAISEGEKRRANILIKLKLEIPSMIAQTEQIPLATAQQVGGMFFVQYAISLESYVEVNNRQVLTDIDNADPVTYYWLDNIIAPSTTIADYMKANLDY